MSGEPSERKSACPHPEAVGKRWGDPISDEQQAELRALAERQREWAAQPEATRGDSVFTGVRLTGADVFWLAEESGPEWDMGAKTVPNLHLETLYVNTATTGLCTH